MMTEKNLVRHELIGLKVEVFESTNKSNKGLKGKIMNETQKLLFVDTKKGLKKIQKKGTIFVFTLPDKKKVKIDGKIIEKRPEDRIKIKIKKW